MPSLRGLTLPRINGKRHSPSTLWRWCRHGLYGVRLEHVRVGRTIATSRQALDRFTVADNGPGIPESIIRGIGDFSVRVSSREAYVAPDRGKQGNALKTLLAMPFVLDGDHGALRIATGGVAHRVEMRLDRVRQQPLVRITREPALVRNGTAVTVVWPDSAFNPGRGEGAVLTTAR